MKTLTFVLLLIFSMSAFAYYPTWNPEWDTYGNDTQQQQRNHHDDKGWGHNHVKLPAQGDYDWDKHADRGDMHWN